MKITFTSLFLFTCSLVFAQSELTEGVEKLKAPASPASVITGMQPTTVLTPKSYDALETALYNNFTDEGSIVIPKDLAIEFSPFWSGKKKVSFHDYLHPTFGQALWMNTAISIASSQSYLLGDSSKSNVLGLGLRSSVPIHNTRDTEIVNEYIDSMDIATAIRSNFNASLSFIFNTKDPKTVADFVSYAEPSLMKILTDKSKLDQPYSITDAKNIAKNVFSDTLAISKYFDGTTLKNDTIKTRAIRDSLYSRLNQMMSTDLVLERFSGYLSHRQGWYLDAAVASLINFPTNDFEFSYVPKNAIWFTPSYSFLSKDQKRYFTVLAVSRYEWFNLDYFKSYFPGSSVYRNNFDYGVAFAGDFEKCYFQFELLGRKSSTEIPAAIDANGNTLYLKEKKDDLQYALTLNYRLTSQVVLTYNLGNKFDPILNPTNTLISSLSLNFGFGTPNSSTFDILNSQTKTQR